MPRDANSNSRLREEPALARVLFFCAARTRAQKGPPPCLGLQCWRSPHFDLGLDGNVERGGDQTGLLRLLGQLARLRLVGSTGLDLQMEQQPGEAEASLGTHAGDAVGVDLQLAVAEACAGGQTGER